MKGNYYILEELNYKTDKKYKRTQEAMKDNHNKKISFQTKEEAENYLKEMGVSDNFLGSWWRCEEIFIFINNPPKGFTPQFISPRYQIRKISRKTTS